MEGFIILDYVPRFPEAFEGFLERLLSIRERGLGIAKNPQGLRPARKGRHSGILTNRVA
jgi:hypothetical protein